jgi:hypothetical protein
MEYPQKLFSINNLDLEISMIKEILQILDLCKNLNRCNLQNLVVSLFIYIQLYYYPRTGNRIDIKSSWTIVWSIDRFYPNRELGWYTTTLAELLFFFSIFGSKMKVKILLLFAIFTLTSFIKAQDTTSTFLMDRLYIEKQINCILSLRQCDSTGKRIIGKI